jgi:hypothetical protein
MKTHALLQRDWGMVNSHAQCTEWHQTLRGRAFEKVHNLDDNAFDRHKFTIRKRAERKNLSGRRKSQTSPVETVEATIVAYCIKCSRIGQPLTHEQVLALAIVLIEDTVVAAKVVCSKKKYSQYSNNQPLLGKAGHNTFMSRHHDILRKGEACTKYINHQEWVMYESFSKMYKAVYKMMVTAGVAKKLPEAVWWFDQDGHIVFNEEEAFGKKSKYFLEHPEYCIYVDETSSNKNQKQDGHLGGKDSFCQWAKLKLVGLVLSTTFTLRC